MRVTSVLLSLAALAPFAFAQDNAGGEAAPAPAAEGGDAGAQAGSGGEAAHKTGSAVGAHSSNTGHGGGTGNQDWVLSTFDVPNRNYYWVNEVNNTATWTPVNVTTNLAIYNSNSSVLDGNKEIAAGIPAGVGSWTGLVSGFAPGNNYIMILTLGDQPDRKIAQTEGFWIKSKGTIPEASVTGAGNSIAGTLAVGSATNRSLATAANDAAVILSLLNLGKG
ncbi:hypothetical protein A1Q2_07911 [Trichosporon asahii var. asahii CBS 8904]|uniref:Uncharacterized protein n=1 Tax=Trichosporon asahii var. asahii (strain CBS 8904) TaxID=1220162 RepID=K1VLX5_TRIAC|nr:hypothetical protein A1Q2_07911 [Trichosporon asahii var. asahii CBS 8904]